jgi:hypothetical protein
MIDTDSYDDYYPRTLNNIEIEKFQRLLCKLDLGNKRIDVILLYPIGG